MRQTRSKGVGTVKTLHTITAVGAAAVTAALVGTAFAAGTATKPVAFTQTFKGTATVVVEGEAATISSVKGAGSGTPLGKATLSGKGAGTKSDPCPLFGGKATMTTKRGKLNFTIKPATGSACTDEAGQDFSLSGAATFNGGTLKYKKVKGTFRFSGSYNRGTGDFSVKFKGTYKL
jgi:hypothetical protein